MLRTPSLNPMRMNHFTATAWLLLSLASLLAADPSRNLEFYWIDSEGGGPP